MEVVIIIQICTVTRRGKKLRLFILYCSMGTLPMKHNLEECIERGEECKKMERQQRTKAKAKVTQYRALCKRSNKSETITMKHHSKTGTQNNNNNKKLNKHENI